MDTEIDYKFRELEGDGLFEDANLGNVIKN